MPMASIAEPRPDARFEMGEMPPFDVLDDFVHELERLEQASRANVTPRGLALSGERVVRAVAGSVRQGAAHLFDVSAPRRRMMGEIAACLVAGLALVNSGRHSPGRPMPITATQTVAISSPSPIAGGHPVGREFGALARSAPSIQSRQSARRFSTKHVARPMTEMATRSDLAPRDPPRGRLERLHLGWLRTRVIFREDL